MAGHGPMMPKFVLPLFGITPGGICISGSVYDQIKKKLHLKYEFFHYCPVKIRKKDHGHLEAPFQLLATKKLDNRLLKAYMLAMNTIEQINRELEQTIARKVRSLRHAKEWSLDKLADVTGLSKSYLSQIENCEKTPTIPTLLKIAYAFKVNVQALLGDEFSQQERVRLSIVKPTERRPIIRPGTSLGYEYMSLTHKKNDRIMDGYLLTAGFDVPPEPLQHEGQELVYMLEGTQEFIYDGKTHVVSEGDCLYFDSDRPHMSRSLGNRPARFLVVFCNPKDR